jgi:hypothetical protein
MWRHGTTQSGAERYRCAVCTYTTIIHRPDTHIRHDYDRLVAWLTGTESKDAIAQRYGVSRRTLSRAFKPFFAQEHEGIPPYGFSANMLIVDAKFIHGSTLCVLIAVTEFDRIFSQFASAECYGTWYAFLVRFAPPRVVVADGHKGMARFVQQLWPHTAFQRCHFHMVSLVIHYLSRSPKDDAGKAILKLMYRLKTVKTHEEKRWWLMFHRIWEKQYEREINEKTEAGSFRNRKLRSVRRILRRALPDLFTYLDHPGCPNTTNLVEGWVNATLAEGLRRHRGMRVSQKKTLVSIILSHLRREAPKRTLS